MTDQQWDDNAKAAWGKPKQRETYGISPMAEMAKRINWAKIDEILLKGLERRDPIWQKAFSRG